MASSFLKRLFGDSSTKELKKIEPLVKAVEALEDQYSALSDEALESQDPGIQRPLPKRRDAGGPFARSFCRLPGSRLAACWA